METYPNPCCRCGFCCLTETCPVGMSYFEISKADPCLALFFDGDEATCTLVASFKYDPFDRGKLLAPDLRRKLFGIGTGCCIKARAFKDGKEYDFASLSPELKRKAAAGLRARKEKTHMMRVTSCSNKRL